IQGRRAVLALSARTWLLYNYQSKYLQAPLSYEPLEHAASFSSEMCPEGFAAIAGEKLHILTTDNLGGAFNQQTLPLRYTPRRMVRAPGHSRLAIIESDHDAYNETEKQARKQQQQGQSNGHEQGMDLANGHDAQGLDGDAQPDEQDESVQTTLRGPLPPS